MKDTTPDQLAATAIDEAIGKEIHWDILGTTDDTEPTAFGEESGALHDKRWEKLVWSRPAKETTPCWWLVNAVEEDKTKPPSLLSRSLAGIWLELNASRCVTNAKFRRAYQRRAEDNAQAVDVLHNNHHLWRQVGGPSPDDLFWPTHESLERPQHACTPLGELRAAHGARDGFDEFADEIIKAVGIIKNLEWEDIRVERFNLIQPCLFTELVRNAESLLQRQAAELVRRQAWLASPVEEEAGDCHVPAVASTTDKDGVDLNVFRMKTGRKPKRWAAAYKTVAWIHIDEIWSLLELHYDKWYFNRWKDNDGRVPQRKGECKASI